MSAYPSSHRRRGTTITEFVVACTLLSSLMLLLVPSAIRIGRVQQTLRQERIAMDEVTNQLERLTLYPLDQLPQKVDQLTPSELAASRLPDAELRGALERSEDGYRLALEISWNSPGRREAPLKVATWIYPASTSPAEVEDTTP